MTLIYSLISIAALGFDLLTDHSFGAIMLAVIPVSFIALSCLVLATCLKNPDSQVFLTTWLVGAALILVISIAFSLHGVAEAETGELIFTYSAMIMALPSSLMLPFLATCIEPIIGDNVILRIIGMWIACVVAGWLEWWVLRWIYSKIQRLMCQRNPVNKA